MCSSSNCDGVGSTISELCKILNMEHPRVLQPCGSVKTFSKDPEQFLAIKRVCHALLARGQVAGLHPVCQNRHHNRSVHNELPFTGQRRMTKDWLPVFRGSNCFGDSLADGTSGTTCLHLRRQCIYHVLETGLKGTDT